MMASATPQPAPTWSEDELIEALALLENMQEQLDHLRTIPSGIVRALGATHLTPEEYFKNFLVPTHGGSRSLNKFATEWHGPPLRRIVDHARVREREDPDLSAGLSVPKYGWAALVSGEDGRVKQKEGEGRRTAKGEVEALVKGFRDANEKVKVEFDAVTLVIKIQLKVPLWKMKFVLTPAFDGKDNVLYEVDCIGTKPAPLSIKRCINKRANPNDLKYLLNMIAAYQDAPLVKCAVCNETMNKDALHPTGRRSKQIKNEQGEPQTIWEPFHESCA